MGVFGGDGGRLAEVDAHSLAHDFFAVEDLTDADGGFFREEGNDYAGERFQRGPGMNGGGCVDEFFDGLKIVCAEDLAVF